MGGVNWQNIAAAMRFYTDNGFCEIQVPWAVSPEAMRSTSELPYWPAPQGLGLVASAEQSFYQLMLNGNLPDGDYVACTPCFRFEETYDEIHAPYFMKVELISVWQYPTSPLTLTHLAMKFMKSLTSVPMEHVQTADGYDIEIGGIEVGSYGLRSVNGNNWSYGTGLAEPRFTVACEIASGL